MSLEQEQIKAGLAQFAASYGPAAIMPAAVLAINEDDTIQIELSSGAIVDDARLKSVVKEGNRVLLIPKVGSTVQVGRIENSDEYLVVAVDEITKVLYIIGDSKFEVNENGYLVAAGGENLLTIMNDFIDACINERHTTKNGPTIKMTATSVQKFTGIKNRLKKLLRDA